MSIETELKKIIDKYVGKTVNDETTKALILELTEYLNQFNLKEVVMDHVEPDSFVFKFPEIPLKLTYQAF